MQLGRRGVRGLPTRGRAPKFPARRPFALFADLARCPSYLAAWLDCSFACLLASCLLCECLLTCACIPPRFPVCPLASLLVSLRACLLVCLRSSPGCVHVCFLPSLPACCLTACWPAYHCASLPLACLPVSRLPKCHLAGFPDCLRFCLPACYSPTYPLSYLPTYMLTYLPTCLSPKCPPVCLHACLFTRLPGGLPASQLACSPAYPRAGLLTCVAAYLIPCLPACSFSSGRHAGVQASWATLATACEFTLACIPGCLHASCSHALTLAACV